MDKVFNFLYFGFFLISFILILKILLSSNFEKLFKQGKILEIRFAYAIVTFILSFLFSSSLTKLLETIYNLVIK
jgi:uncharacterized membrane protein YwzB